jgi:hypothetical protein
MQSINFRRCARTVCVLVAGLSAGLSFAQSPQTDAGFVAYIDRIIPSDARLADIATITPLAGQAVGRGKDIERRLKDNPVKFRFRLGDRIDVTRQDAVVMVRLLATNETVLVTKDKPLPFQQSAVPGLLGSVATWLIGVFQGSDQAGDSKTATTASRGVNTGPCYNETRKTNEPVMFRIPILAASRSVLAAGNRAIFVSWQGGVPPFSVTLSTAETGVVIAKTTGVNACAGRLPSVSLTPGHYRLAVTDANNVAEQEESLFSVVGDAPTTPRELREADIPEEARQLYTATWMTVLDGGEWAFEAQQRVAAMDCHSAAVQDWLRHWGGPMPCN